MYLQLSKLDYQLKKKTQRLFYKGPANLGTSSWGNPPNCPAEGPEQAPLLASCKGGGGGLQPANRGTSLGLALTTWLVALLCGAHRTGRVGWLRPGPHRAAQPKTSALRILRKYMVGMSIGWSCWLTPSSSHSSSSSQLKS